MGKSKRGFAALTAEMRKKIASMGGKASQAKGGHRWSAEEAKAFGSLGGKASQAKGGNTNRFTSKTGKAAAQARMTKARIKKRKR